MPQHEFRTLHVTTPDSLFPSAALWETLASELAACHLVLWASPVYSFMIPAPLKAFFEMLMERNERVLVRNKPAAALMTSTHLGDQIAIDYLRSTSEDLEMVFVGAHSAELFDLTTSSGRRDLETFFTDVVTCVETGFTGPRRSPKTQPPPEFGHRVQLCPTPTPTFDFRVVIVFDDHQREKNLIHMVDAFRQGLSGNVRTVPLSAFSVDNPCLGNTTQCGGNYVCDRNDNFTRTYEQELLRADILVYAGSIRDRFLSARWKSFFDRSFFRGHVPSFSRKQLVWIISGSLSTNPVLQEFIESYTEFQMANLSGILSDESLTEEFTASAAWALGARCLSLARAGFARPPTQRGIAISQICRHVVLRNKLMFPRDFTYFNKGGGYALREHTLSARWLGFILAAACRIPFVRQKFVENFFFLAKRPLERVLARERKGVASVS
jgi:multimeric flavodoxin WrbA